MPPRKPTGQIGATKLEISDGAPVAHWDKIVFPSEKEDIEKKIVGYFYREMLRQGYSILEANQNKESYIDYSLSLPSGKVDLELRELLYRDDEDKPYDSRQIKIMTLSYAQQIYDAVHKKSKHYQQTSAVPIHLLMYVTHWRFVPHEAVIRIAQHLLAETPPIFENVFLLLPFDETEAMVRVLYPSTNPMEGKRIEDFADEWYLNLDPANAQLHTNCAR